MRGARPFGRVSNRTFLFSVTLVMMTLLSAIVIPMLPAAAAGEATWSDQGQLVYQDKTYAGPLGNGADTPAPSVVPKKSGASYLYRPDNLQGKGQVKIIYFASGSDATSATSAQLITATYDVQSGHYSDPSPPKKITVTPSSDASSAPSSCQSAGGIGWLVCPISNKLAEGVDYLYNTVAGYLRVQTLSGDQTNVIYRGWSYMRNIANITFVIAFMIIIYSQITGAGMSNYGLKKLLPRLIAAAILMNISYWVCALAVDLSNFLGYSLENFFMSMRDGLTAGHSVQYQMPTWGTVTAAVLGLGAVAWGTTAIVVSSGGVLALLLPILLGVGLSVLVALIILAARQAILVVLIIVSPLAFSAFLLPNTEKYFHKWRESFMTLLLLFPIFSVLFGGAQLAGGAIILTAHSIGELIFGMAIQVVPLAITPILIKLSTSTLGQVAGMINNPKKGLVDRSRNWAKGFNEDQTNRGMPYNKFARSFHNRKRAKSDRRESRKNRADNIYHGSRQYQKIDQANRAIEREKQRIEQHHDMEWNVRLKVDPNQFEQEMHARTTGLEAEAAKARVDTMYDEFKGGHMPSSLYPYGPVTETIGQISNRATDATRDVALTAMRKRMAEAHEKRQLTEELLENTETIDGKQLRDYAGGVMGTMGAEGVLAQAVTESRKQYQENVDNKKQLIKHFNLSGGQRQNLAMGDAGDIHAAKDGVNYEFRIDDIFAREAAIEMQMGGMGNVENIEKIVGASGSSLEKYKTTISQMIVDGRVPDKVSYLSGKSIDDVAQGKIKTDEDLTALTTRAIAQGKVKPAQLVNMDYTALQRIQTAVTSPDMKFTTAQADIDALDARRDAIYRGAYEALKNGNLRGNIAGNSYTVIEELASHDPRSNT